MNENLSDEIISIGADRDSHATLREERIKQALSVFGASHPAFNPGPHRVVESLFPIDIFATPCPADTNGIQTRHECAALGITMRKKAPLHHVDAVRTRLLRHGIIPLQFRNTAQPPLPVSLVEHFFL